MEFTAYWSIFEFTIELTWDHRDFIMMEPKEYRQFTRLFSDTLSAMAPVE